MSLEHDIGFSAMLFTLFIGLLWVTTGRTGYLLLGVVLFAVGAYLAGRYSAQTHIRVEDWLDPWKYWPTSSGEQLVQSWYALGSGGIGGSGLGLGAGGLPASRSANATSSSPSSARRWGCSVRPWSSSPSCCWSEPGLRIAQAARSEFAKLTAVGLTMIIGFQAFFIIGGVLRLLPLTGITLPFVSYGGSALVANYVLVALLMRISDEGTRGRGRGRAEPVRYRTKSAVSDCIKGGG